MPDDQRPPYRGLLAFEPEDAPLFGGRETATNDILALLQLQPIVALIGASGSGKSSVAKAGVIARLRRQRIPTWRVLTLRPGADPLLALARALGGEIDRDVDEDGRIVKARERVGLLFENKANLSDYLARIVELRTQPGAPPPRLLVFVDQWEELYTQTEDRGRGKIFLDQLLAAFTGGPHRLLVTMRADFMSYLLDGHRPFFDATKPGMLPLPRMSRKELAEAIRKPSETVGLKFDDGLVEAILEDAGDEPGVLALVEFTLTQLWERRDKDDNRLTLAGYHALGGLKGAIDRHADAVYGRLSPEQQADARRALMRLVHVSTLESYTRAPRPLSDMDDSERAILRSLAHEDSRLVVISHDEGLKAEVAEVSHEALIREWRRLHDWVAADPGFLQWREEIDRRRRRYEEKGQHSQDLLQGSALEEAKSWLLTRGSAWPGNTPAQESDVPRLIRTFIEASNDYQVKVVARHRRLSAAATVVSVAVALVLAIGGVLLNNARQTAEKEKQRAQEQTQLAEDQTIRAKEETKRAENQTQKTVVNETRALSALAEVALQRHRPMDSVKLGLAAWPRRRGDSRPQLEIALRALSNTISQARLPAKVAAHDGPVNGALVMPDGRILTWSDDNTVRLWDASTGAQVGPAMRHDKSLLGLGVGGALVMPDGRILSWSHDNTLRLWDASTGVQVGPAMRHDKTVDGALVMPDGRILSWSRDNTLRLWDASTGTQVGSPMRHDKSLLGVGGALVMPDGRILSWSGDNTLRLWDASTGAQVGPAMRHDPGPGARSLMNGLKGALAMPDGRILSWSDGDNTLRLWDASTGAQVGPAMRHDKSDGGVSVVSGALVMPDGRILSWSGDDTLRLWDASSGTQVGPAMRHDKSDFGVGGALVMPDGRILSWSHDNTLRLWDASTGAQVGPAMRHDKSVNAALVMPDGRILSWSGDNTVRLWDASTGAQVGPAMDHDEAGSVSGALVMPDGRILSWSGNKTHLWETRTGAQIGPAMRHDEGGVSGALAMPNSRILSWSGDNTLRLWDLSAGTQVGSAMRHDKSDHGVKGALVMPDGRILSWSGDDTLRLWDASTGVQDGPAMRHDKSEVGVNGALVMPDGRILSWSGDNTLRLWDASTGAQVGPAVRHDKSVGGALVMPDGRILSWSGDDTLRLWDASSGTQVGPAMRHDKSLLGVGGALVMPDGRILSWSHDNTLRLWDASTGAQVGPAMRHDPGSFILGVKGALVMPDGRILSWSGDNTLRLWNASTGAQVGPAMRHDESPLMSFGVNGALVMPDGRILSWSYDNTLRLWDASNGAQVGPAMRHDKSVDGALVMPDGRILSWSGDNTLRLWDASTVTQIGPSMRHAYSALGVSGALVMPGGRLLSWSGSGENALRLWDATWPQGSLFNLVCMLLADKSLDGLADRYVVVVTEPICQSPENIPLPDWQGTIERVPAEQKPAEEKQQVEARQRAESERRKGETKQFRNQQQAELAARQHVIAEAEKNHQYDRAADESDRALALNPDDPDLVYTAFRMRMYASRIDQAEELAPKVVARKPADAMANLILAGRSIKKSDYRTAELQIGRMGTEIQLGPINEFMLVWLKAGEKDFAASRAAFTKLNLNNGERALVIEAQIDEMAGDKPAAEAKYRRVIGLDKNNLRTMVAVAEGLRRLGKADEANQMLRTYGEKYGDSVVVDGLIGLNAPVPKPPTPASGISDLLFDIGSVGAADPRSAELALTFYLLALDLRPDNDFAWMLLSTLYEQFDLSAKATAALAKIVPSSPLFWQARLRIASLDAKEDHFDQAVSRLQAMIAEKPERIDAAVTLADLLRSKERYAEAAQAYDTAIQRVHHPEERYWPIYFGRGIVLERLKQWPKAEQDMKKALELSPDQPLVLNYLAYSWIDQGLHLTDAMKMLERASELQPDDGDITDSVGWAFYRLGQYDKAVEKLEKANKQKTDNATIIEHLGDAYWHAGRFHEARLQWERTLNKHPDKDRLPVIKDKLANGLSASNDKPRVYERAPDGKP